MADSLNHGDNSSDSPYSSPHETLAEVVSSNSFKAIANAIPGPGYLYIVGGTVRQALLGQVSSDLDLATPLLPDKVQSALEKQGIRVVPTALQHGTVTAFLEDSKVEITTFRQVGPQSESNFSKTIEEDLAGRDFTINAIAYHVSEKLIIDPFNGQKDIETNHLRAVGSAEDRFMEDPLRILRMIRFGPAAARNVDENTLAAAEKLVDKLHGISPERIRDEISKIIVSPHSTQAFRSMIDLKILDVILPEALPSVGFEQNAFHDLDVFEHTLKVIENCPADLTIRLSALFHDLGKPATLSIGPDGRRHFYNHEMISTQMTTDVMQRLHFPGEVSRRVKNLVALHMRPVQCGKPGVRRLFRDLKDDFAYWLILKRADAFGCKHDQSNFLEDLNRFNQLVVEEEIRLQGAREDKLAISGHDLIKAGLPPGKLMGSILNELQEIILENPELNKAEFLLSKAKEIYATRS